MKKPKFNIVFGSRCCSRCSLQKPNGTGEYEVFNNGKNQRWICVDCKKLKEKRNAQNGIAGAFSDLNRHPENAAVPGVLILRLDAPMYYANALSVRERTKALVAESQPPPRAILLDSAGQDSLDITSAEVLKGLLIELKDKGIEIYVSELHAPVREFSQRTGLLELIGEDHVFPTVEAAVSYIEQSAHTGKAKPGV